MGPTIVSYVLLISDCFQLAVYVELTRNYTGQRSSVFLLFLFALEVSTAYVGFFLMNGVAPAS